MGDERERVIPIWLPNNGKIKQSPFNATTEKIHDIKSNIIQDGTSRSYWTITKKYYYDNPQGVSEKKYGNGYFDIARSKQAVSYSSTAKDLVVNSDVGETKSHVFAIHPGGRNLEVGDRVLVSANANNPFQKPVILSEKGAGAGIGKNLNPIAPPTIDPVSLVAGLWLQATGYWWTPNYSRDKQPVFNLGLPQDHIIIKEVVHFIPSIFDGLYELHFDHVVDFSQAAKLYNDDGDILVFPSSHGFTGSSDARTDLNIPNVHSVFYVNLSDINVDSNNLPEPLYADYHWKDELTSYVVNNLDIPFNTQDKSIDFGGLVMFPEGEEQIVATLVPHYVPNSDYFEYINETKTFKSVDKNTQPDLNNNEFTENNYITVNSSVNAIAYSDVSNVHVSSPNFAQNLKINVTQDNWYSAGSNKYAILLIPAENDTWSVKLILLVQTELKTNWQRTITTTTGKSTYYIPTDGQDDDGSPYQYNTDLGTFNGASVSIISISRVYNASYSEEITDYTFSDGQITFGQPFEQDDLLIDITGDFYKLDFREFDITLDQNNTLIHTSYQETIEKLIYANINGLDATKYIFRLNATDYKPVAYFEPNDTLDIQITTKVPLSDYFKIDKLNIVEKNLYSLETRNLEIPLPDFYDANPFDLTDSSERFRDAHRGFWQLFFDPKTSAYMVAGPYGFIWRSRKLLEEAADSGPVPHAWYVNSMYLDDGYSTDKAYNSSYDHYVGSNGNTKRRNNPWLCCSISSNFALQGSWKRWGGYYGDYNFKIHLWLRNHTTYKPELISSVSVGDLMANVTSSKTRYVCPSGTTDILVGNRPRIQYNPATYEFNSNLIPLEGWPITFDRKAWIVAAGWACTDFESPFMSGWNPQHGVDDNTFGFDDAGLTFNAISPVDGSILATYTYKAALSFIDRYVDVSLDRTNTATTSVQAIEALKKKYVPRFDPSYIHNNNGVQTIDPPYMTTSFIYEETVGFGNELTEYTRPWFVRYQIKAFQPETHTILKYPGPASLAVGPSAKWKWNSPSSSREQEDLNQPSGQYISLDEENFIYTTLNSPCWYRDQDSILFHGYRTVFQSFIVDYPGATHTTSPNNTLTIYFCPDGTEVIYDSRYGIDYSNIQVAAGAAYISNCVDLITNQPVGFSNYGGFQGGAEYFKRFLLYPQSYYTGTGPLIIGENGEYDTNPDGSIKYYSFYNYPPMRVKITYARIVFDPQKAVKDADYTMRDNVEVPTTNGYQGFNTPFNGLRVYNWTADWRHEYQIIHKSILLKLKFTGDNFEEVWQQDISQYADWPASYLNSDTSMVREQYAKSQPIAGSTRYTLKIGRYIVVARDNMQIETSRQPVNFLRSQIEFYLDGSSSPNDPVYTVNLENSDQVARISNNDASYPNDPPGYTIDPAIITSMTGDVLSDGREQILVWHVATKFGKYSTTQKDEWKYITKITLPAPDTNDPILVEQKSAESPASGNDYFPTVEGAPSLARAKGVYCWRRPNEIAKRDFN